MAPPPPLMGELVEEILLRFPPADPASLVRAALVCKPWCQLVSGRRFRRRFRDFHRSAPVLALLCNSRHELCNYDDGDVLRFVPAVPFPGSRRAFRRHNYRRAIDARHGRVLLRGMLWLDDGQLLREDDFVVWSPMTGEERVVPPPICYEKWNAAVVCAAHATGACDHLGCHRGPFLVVLVVTLPTEEADTFVYVYSSETGSWSNQQAVPQGPSKAASWLWPSVLAENSLCFMLRQRRSILRYDLGTMEISVIDDLPPTPYKPDVLTTTEDGRLGFAAVHQSRLFQWTRDAGRWAQSGVVELQKLLPAAAATDAHSVVGFADGVGTLFVGTKSGVYSVDLKSQKKARNVYEGDGCNVLPYMSFYIPAVGGVFTGEGPSEGASSA